jgi:ankyrin repeat protein
MTKLSQKRKKRGKLSLKRKKGGGPESEQEPVTIFNLTNRVSNEDFEKVVKDAAFNINEQNPETGNTLLHEAILANNEQRAKILIDHGANINIQNRKGDTPLHIAVLNDEKIMVKLLVKHSANIDVKNSQGETPRSIVETRYGEKWLKPKWTKLLTEQPQKPDNLRKEKDKFSIFSFFNRSKKEKEEVEKEEAEKEEVEKEEAEKEEAEKEEAEQPKTIFEAVDKIKDLKTLDEFLGKIQEKLDGSHEVKNYSKFWYWINQLDKDKQTVLYNAIDAGNEPLAEVLAKYTSGGFSTNNKPELNIAAEKNFKKVAQLLINNGASIHSKDYRGITPFIYAVKNKSKELVELLLKNGASGYTTDEHGDTVIHIALKNKSKEIVELLMKDRLLKYATNDAGETTQSIAEKMDKENMAANRKPEWLELIIGKEEFERREKEELQRKEIEQKEQELEELQRKEKKIEQWIKEREQKEQEPDELQRKEKKERERQEIEQWKREREERKSKKTKYKFRKSNRQENIEKCTDNLVSNNTKISLTNAINLCSTVNGILTTPDERNIPEKFDKVLHKWFNDTRLIEEIFKTLRSKNLCFLHEIDYFEASKNFKIYSHLGKVMSRMLDLNYNKYYEDEIKNCDSKLIAIPVGIKLKDGSGHATTLIIDRTGEIDDDTGKEIIIAEYFDSSTYTYHYVKDFEAELLKFITTLFGDKYTYDFIGQMEICPDNIQGRLNDTDYQGTCTQFQIWYAFKRLLEPYKSRKTVIKEMYSLLKKGVPAMIKLIKSFQSILVMHLYESYYKNFSGRVNGTRMKFYDFDGGKKQTKRRAGKRGPSKLTSRKLTSRLLAQRNSLRKHR